ncbi:MAG: ABC-2 transporter permease [Desulfitobacterium sp.]|nr:ABC-2 transporter permease [Desulfitobacterium sp.]
MMTKMIALDWRAMKVYQIRGLLLPVFIFFLGFYSPLLVIPMSVFMFLSFSINPFAVEEKGELNNLYLTLPVSRKSIVTGRYLLSLIMLLCGIVTGTLLMPLVNKFSLSKWYIGIEGYIAIIALSCLLYAFLNLFMFPILFRFGYNKGKFWGFYLPVVLFAILFSSYVGFSSMPQYSTLTLDFIVFASENLLLVSGCLAALATVILLLSYLLSLKLYSKRDF